MEYIICFHHNVEWFSSEYYTGKTFCNAGEKYAGYCDKENAKKYKSKRVAEKVALKLFNTCENIDKFEIVEVE